MGSNDLYVISKACLVWIFLHNLYDVTWADEDCKKIKFSGPYIKTQSHRVGFTYTKIDTELNNRPAFKREQAPDDFVYWKQIYSAWSVGPQLNGTGAGMVCIDMALHPVDVGAHWWVRTGTNGTVPSKELKVECVSDGFPAWGVGLLVLGALAVIAGTSGLACWCMYSKAKRRPGHDASGEFFGVVPEHGTNKRRDRSPRPGRPRGEPRSSRDSGQRTHGLFTSGVVDTSSYPVQLE